MNSWKRRALADPNLKYKYARLIMNGPKSLSQAWILQGLKLKYCHEFRNTTGTVEN
jgi:hypothetical protein